MALAIFFLVGILVALGVFFFFSIRNQLAETEITGVRNLLNNYFSSFQSSIDEIDQILEKFHLGNGILSGNFQKMQRLSIANLNGAIYDMFYQTKNISKYVVNFGLGFVLSLYFLIDKNLFILYGNVLGRILLKEDTYYRWKRWYYDVDQIFSGYVRGQTADVLFMAVAISVLLTIIGIKYGILIGCIAGLCNYIPYLGPTVAYVGTISFGLLNGQEKQVLVAIVLLFLLQQLDGSYIAPRFMEKNIAVSPVFLLIGVILGGNLFGLKGVILAIPMTALWKVIFLRFLEKRLIEKGEFRKNEKCI